MAKTKPERDEVREAIAERIEELVGDGELLRLALIGIGGVLHRHHKAGGDWSDLLTRNTGSVMHVLDWLTASLVNAESWLARTDSAGRPLKLTKMHSIEQLVHEADKAMLKASQKLSKAELADGEEALEMELDEGYRVVRLLSVTSLDRESARMQHCVGNGGYDGHLDAESGRRHGLFSLRDNANNPHATIEVDFVSKSLLQLKGKQNVIPIRRYMFLLSPFIQSLNLVRGTDELGFVADAAGKIHHVSAIPDDTAFAGDLSLANPTSDVWFVAPRGVSVEKDLIVSQSYSPLLAESTKVGGSVVARNVTGITISDSLTVGGDWSFDGSIDLVFPDTVHVKGDFSLKDVSDIRMPRKLVVDGNMDISMSDIPELPDFLSVGGSLTAVKSSLRRLGHGTRIGGSLFLGETTQMDTLPSDLFVGENLMLRKSAARHLPDGLVVGGMVSIDGEVAKEFTVSGDATAEGGVYLRDVATGGVVVPFGEFRAARAVSALQSSPTP